MPGRKKVAAPPKTAQKNKQVKKNIQRPPHPAFVRRQKRFNVGGDIPKKRDVSRFIKYPKYIQVQRKKKILLDRLKVPPQVNQFSFTIEKSARKELFRLLGKYKPETKAEKKKRLKEVAAKKVKGEKVEKPKKPNVVKYGVNHVTALVENNKAKLVLIAHDVDPLEIVLWLPTLCRAKKVPYMIVKGKAQLGSVVNKKKTAVLALTSVNEEDKADLAKLCELAKQNFNDAWSHVRTQWGGKKLGNKALQRIKKKEKNSN